MRYAAAIHHSIEDAFVSEKRSVSLCNICLAMTDSRIIYFVLYQENNLHKNAGSVTINIPLINIINHVLVDG